MVKPPKGLFFITPEITYLLDSPGYAGNVLAPLYRGDKVELVDAGNQPGGRLTSSVVGRGDGSERSY